MRLRTHAPTGLMRSLLLAALVVGALLAFALGASKRLSVRRSSGGSLRRLKAGDKLRLGDHVVMGSRVTATLHLNRPKDVDADTELIDLAPAAGASHDVAVSRNRSRTTVKITPAG